MKLSKDWLSANWGLEREVLRVDEEGRLARSRHPFPPGHRKITVDWAEAQTELITGVHPSPDGALDELQDLQSTLQGRLGSELLWPFSVPGVWERGQSPEAARFGDDPGWGDQRTYRKTLEARHGGARQVLSGIHVNYSFGPRHPGGDSFALARNFLRYQPVLSYLLAASPWLSAEYRGALLSFRSAEAGEAGVRCGSRTTSVRQGPLGYALAEEVEAAVDLRYDSLEEYLQKLARALTPVDGGTALLASERELYAAVRPKGRSAKGQTLEALARDGVEYLEFRIFDLDPLAPLGIRRDTLLFLELFFAACAALDSPRFGPRDLPRIRRTIQSLTQCSLGRTRGAPRQVRALWRALEPTLAALAAEAGREHEAALTAFQDQIEGRTLRTVDRVVALMAPVGPLAWGLGRARLHRDWFSLELSTRLVIEEADRRGIRVELLDAQDNFVGLHRGRRTEYVKQATRTSADPYVAALVMENKEVTKIVLRQRGIAVPEGQSFASLEAARAAVARWRGRQAVVKPNATNFGQGVTILEADASATAWDEALALGFSLDSQVLIETFAPGLEFRFLVIGGRTVAILQRIPANVVGDGTRSIRQLVDAKNQHPWRGEGYRKPLEKLRLDETETSFLGAQGWSADDVPAAGQQVFLRKNSNISTGGDSLDFTDAMPPRFARVAEEAAAAVGARICGVDMILPDWQDPSPTAPYTILELNFNPALHIHTYPAVGENRHPAKEVVKLLFPKG